MIIHTFVLHVWLLKICMTIMQTPWPVLSPDLLPIWNIWDGVNRCVGIQQMQPYTLLQLYGTLSEVLITLLLNVVRHCIRSMYRRCISVIGASGGHTRYWLCLSEIQHTYVFLEMGICVDCEISQSSME